MAKGNNKAILGVLLTFILGGLVTERTFTWNALAQLEDKKVEKKQYEKDQEAWQKRLDEAIIRIEKSGEKGDAKAEELQRVMNNLLLELRTKASK